MRLTIRAANGELICPSCQRVAGAFACDVGQITGISSRVPGPIRGAFRDRHERWMRDAVDAGYVKRRMTLTSRTAKSCGPDIPTLMSSRWQCHALRW